METDMARFIKLQRSGMTAFIEGRTQGFRIQIEVLEAVGLPKEIFVYQVKPAVSLEGDPVEVFTNIASPSDIEEYGVGMPPLDPARPFYRFDKVDLVFRNQTLLEDAWAAIKNDVDELIRTLDQMDELVPAEEVTFGVEPSSSSSSSSSSSL
jgi:hypothetical protein